MSTVCIVDVLFARTRLGEGIDGAGCLFTCGHFPNPLRIGQNLGESRCCFGLSKSSDGRLRRNTHDYVRKRRFILFCSRHGRMKTSKQRVKAMGRRRAADTDNSTHQKHRACW